MDFSDCDPQVRELELVVGGVVSPSSFVGRFRELELIQNGVTTANGAVLVGDRRVGKTSVMGKLKHEWSQAGHEVVSVSAQTEDPDVFAANLQKAMAPSSWFKSERKRWTLNIKVGAKGITLERTGGRMGSGPDPEPVDLLTWAAENVAPKRLIVMIDELTVLLGAMSDRSASGREFLNHLRRDRQENDNLSIVLAGSIGLHHVVPLGMGLTNDLHKIVVGPLASCEALELATGLLAGIGLEGADRRVAEHITIAADAIPFYVHWLVQQLQLDGDLSKSPEIRLREAINDPLDPLDFRHYRNRLPGYYGDRARLAELILNHLSVSGPMSPKALLRALDAETIEPRPTHTDVTQILEKLELDNYLKRDVAGANQFANELLAMAWRIIQRLEE